MPRLRWIEAHGFRAFGNEGARLELDSNLAIICGPNSQGKTSLVEALEFLLTGGTVRREFLASAKAEFSDCLRNVYLPNGTEVFVRAEIADSSGDSHIVSRKLLTDYTAQDDCRTELTIDGVVVDNLDCVGIFLSEPPLRARACSLLVASLFSSRMTKATSFWKIFRPTGQKSITTGLSATAKFGPCLHSEAVPAGGICHLHSVLSGWRLNLLCEA
jgi:AAA domain-containing protein